jgi:hypothetical protein
MWTDGIPEGACLKMLKPDLKLTPQAAMAYQLNTSVFHEALAKAIGIEPHNESCENIYTWQIGSLAAKPGKRRNVFLTYRKEDSFCREIPKLCIQEKTPFVLLTFIRYDLPVATQRILDDFQIERFSLDEILEFKHDCKLELRSPFHNIWDGIIESVESEEKKKYSFNLPPETDWEDISIHFKDAHNVSIIVGNEKVELNYNEMGMADKRNGNPARNWLMLENFAKADGALSWKSSEASDENRQRKLRLCKHLCSIFGLKGDPIPWNKDAKTYVCRFKITPDTKSSIYHPKLRK